MCRGLGPAGPGGGLGGRPIPLVVPCVGDISILLLLPTPCFCSWPFRRPFCILLSVICPSGTCTKLFLAPYSLFVFCRSRCKHCGRGSRSQVPACFIFGREALVHPKSGAVGRAIKMEGKIPLPWKAKNTHQSDKVYDRPLHLNHP